MLVELAFGALLNKPQVVTHGATPSFAWLFNTAIGLSREDEALLSSRMLGTAGHPALMRRVDAAGACPQWLRHGPRCGEPGRQAVRDIDVGPSTPRLVRRQSAHGAGVAAARPTTR